MQASTLSPNKCAACRAVGIRSLAQRGVMSVEVGIWIGSGVLAILGLVQAVHSAQHLLWLAIWPAPVTLLSTIFVFLSQGYYFRNGVLVLGRRTSKQKSHAKQSSSVLPQRRDRLRIDSDMRRPYLQSGSDGLAGGPF
jgi:hypothetical protein